MRFAMTENNDVSTSNCSKCLFQILFWEIQEVTTLEDNSDGEEHAPDRLRFIFDSVNKQIFRILIHDWPLTIHVPHSLLKLSTGFAIAALYVFKSKIITVGNSKINPPIINNHTPGSILKVKF